MRWAIHAKSEKPSKIAAGSKTINSKITSRYMAQSSVDVHIGCLALKLDTSGVARAVSPKEAGLRVQDWDMWLKIFLVRNGLESPEWSWRKAKEEIVRNCAHTEIFVR